MRLQYSSTSAVSMLEVMVAIMIFFLGLISVYSVVSSTLRVNQYNKNFIIASSLASEQLEIIKNIRDYNFKNIRAWNSINADADISLDSGNYYKIANKPGGFLDTKIDIIDHFAKWEAFLNTSMLEYRLCLDQQGVYTYDCINNTPTPFYRYSFIDRVIYTSESWEELVIEDALKINSVVVWYQWWYHEANIATILTDWQRL